MTKTKFKFENAFLKNFLVWFCLCGAGIEANIINQISNGGLMPHIPSSLIVSSPYNYFRGSLNWAFAAPSHFFGDWVRIFKTIWSPGDLLFTTSCLFLIICLTNALLKFVKKFSKNKK